MKDHYPNLQTIPLGALVPPELQPDYVDHPLGQVVGSITDAILGAAHGHRSTVALVHHESGAEYTFGELEEMSARLANALVGLGVTPGDRVAIRCGNRPEGIITALAVWRAGGIVVPVPSQAPGVELRWFLQDVGARVLVAQVFNDDIESIRIGIDETDVVNVIAFGTSGSSPFIGWTEAVKRAAPEFDLEVNPDSVAVIWHTGGTTGTPKACYHTHRRFVAGGRSLAAAIGITPGERWAAAAPIGHALGFIYHTIFTLLHGASCVLIENFQSPSSVLAAVDRHRVTTFAAVTATWAAMQDALVSDPDLVYPAGLSRSFAMWQSASATGVTDWWRSRGTELSNNFGSTAFATWVLVPQGEHSAPPGSMGRPAPGFEVAAIDAADNGVRPLSANTQGRMAVRGLTGLTYWNRPSLQERDVRDGWTLVDDLISFDDDGNAAYLGRTDFLISTAGYKVAPVEVESALATHPAVREVAVVGTPDPLRQEVVTAFVVTVEGVAPSDELRRELQQWVKTILAPYKYPRRLEFVDALPRDAVGKVQQRKLMSWRNSTV
ncbi:MAG TPA: class I adenylate-forming enzyme family protein [Ilumatobacter sp.]|nr:class I adenylate-forming enzyme family protein [Ilumatobacter sp.]